ncbi:uncharacterized protein LOC110975467 isoform X2 [Acanthaster planci]|uniref:Uncharacterized protein LOC110975467 isoform X2 n=1 Tax=Acanthaster planci TaxID=133434 RepID=A0A8B7XUW1_ACAPL|nr:uncharacterized protein LOC110975467 isoform X2 [Acanthaster planci]
MAEQYIYSRLCGCGRWVLSNSPECGLLLLLRTEQHTAMDFSNFFVVLVVVILAVIGPQPWPAKSLDQTRSETYEAPMRVTKKTVYLQSGRAYHLSCPALSQGNTVSVISWYRGQSWDVSSRKNILWRIYRGDGQNSTDGDRYQISPVYGIIIDPVYVNYTGRYWCRVMCYSSTATISEDYLDVFVLEKTFPDNESIVNETATSMDIQGRNTINCSLLPQLQTPTDLITVYWTIKTSDGPSLDIIVAKFPDGVIKSALEYDQTHSLTDKDVLKVHRFSKRQETYCCHVFEQGRDLKTACVDVTWLALATEKCPAIEGFEPTNDDCAVNVAPHEKYQRFDCSISAVYPKPALNWSFSDCMGTPTFFTKSITTENQTTKTLSVKSSIYIVDFEPSLYGCRFKCTAGGQAITDQTSSSVVTFSVTSGTEAPTLSPVSPNENSCICDCSFVVAVILVLFVVLLIYPKSNAFIQRILDKIRTAGRCIFQKVRMHCRVDEGITQEEEYQAGGGNHTTVDIHLEDAETDDASIAEEEFQVDGGKTNAIMTEGEPMLRKIIPSGSVVHTTKGDVQGNP